MRRYEHGGHHVRADGHTGNRSRDDRLNLYGRFAELYQKEMPDTQIAEITGVSDRTVARWRSREKLPTIGERTEEDSNG